ncbi:hypothetical protein V9L05_20590 [Bernardetia sp. Wsw4-3y2]|uniref:hypothetical protein n=1 Tax=Bernardetia sp. Wsw4-3y2 TaxID=3127471 RepID=UPI0030CFCA2F
MAKLTKKETEFLNTIVKQEFENQKNESELLIVEIEKDVHEVWLSSHASFAESLNYKFIPIKRSDLEEK